MTSLRQRMLEELQRRNYSSGNDSRLHPRRQAVRGLLRQVARACWAARRFAGSSCICSEKKLAPGTVEGRMSALRFLYKKVLKRRDLAYDDLIFPKTPGSCRSC